MLALNRRGLVYTNSVEPIEEWETVVSRTVSGTIEFATGEDEDAVGECTECTLVDRQAPHTEATGSWLTPSLF
jgi:hypothetical protein